MRIAVLLAVIAAGAPSVSAQHRCDFFEVKAQKAAQPSMDKSIPPKLQKRLKAPELSRWNSFSVATNKSLQFSLKQTKSMKLSNGNKLSALLRTVEQTKGKKPRFTLSLTADSPKQKRLWESTVHVDQGRFFYISRTSGRILAIRCK